MDDKDIKKRLSEMPRVKDHRSKEAVLARLKADERLQKPIKRQKLPKWLPAFVAIASLLVLSLLLPPMFQKNEAEQIESKQDDQYSRTLDRDETLANSEREMDLQLGDETEEHATTTTTTTTQEFVDEIESLIPENVTYDIRIENGVAHIHFKELLDLLKMPSEDAEAMIEGFILTASHYQSAVQLENVLQKNFGEYDLEAVLPAPAATNP